MARGSATGVTAWQSAQRIDPAPGGTWRGVWQLEQWIITLLYMVVEVVVVGGVGNWRREEG